MFLINGIIPLSNENHRLPDSVYEAVGRSNPYPKLGIFKEVKRGRGIKFEFTPLVDIRAAVRGPAIIFTTELEKIPENCPYIRLIFNIDKTTNTIDPTSVNFIFSEEAGDLKESNYTVKEIS